VFILWRLWLVACRLRLGSWSLGACSLEPLIWIRGPNFSQLLLMILSSVAMVCSCGPEAWLTSIVNFFIVPFIVSAGPSGLALIAVGTGTANDLTNLSSGKSLNELRLHPIISGTGCQACSLLLVAFFFHNFFELAKYHDNLHAYLQLSST